MWLNRTTGSVLEGTATIMAGTVPVTSTPSQRITEQPGAPGHLLSAPPAYRGRAPGERAPILNQSLSLLTPIHRRGSRTNDESSTEEEEEVEASESFQSAQSLSRCTRKSRARGKLRRRMRRRKEHEVGPPDLFFNYTDVPLTEAMKQVLNFPTSYLSARMSIL